MITVILSLKEAINILPIILLLASHKIWPATKFGLLSTEVFRRLDFIICRDFQNCLKEALKTQIEFIKKDPDICQRKQTGWKHEGRTHTGLHIPGKNVLCFHLEKLSNYTPFHLCHPSLLSVNQQQKPQKTGCLYFNGYLRSYL